MAITRTARALAAGSALAVAILTIPATAAAQTAIAVGAPGSALDATPDSGAPSGTTCGTVYVGAYDASGPRPAERPADARAIQGLTVSFIGSQTVTDVTDANGRYCLAGALNYGNETSRFEYDTSAIEAYNAQPGAQKLDQTFHVAGPDDTAFWSDQNMLLKYLYDPSSMQLWKFDIAFDQEPPAPAPDSGGSMAGGSSMIFSIPEVLRGMLHGGAMGS